MIGERNKKFVIYLIKAIVLAVLEIGVHLFPSRTQQLRLSSPMVLRFSRERVGRCQDNGFYFSSDFISVSDTF